MEKNTITKRIKLPCSVAPDGSEAVVRLDEAGIGTFFRENVIMAKLIGEDGRELGRDAGRSWISSGVLPFPDAKLSLRLDGDSILRIH